MQLQQNNFFTLQNLQKKTISTSNLEHLASRRKLCPPITQCHPTTPTRACLKVTDQSWKTISIRQSKPTKWFLTTKVIPLKKSRASKAVHSNKSRSTTWSITQCFQTRNRKAPLSKRTTSSKAWSQLPISLRKSKKGGFAVPTTNKSQKIKMQIAQRTMLGLVQTPPRGTEQGARKEVWFIQTSRLTKTACKNSRRESHWSLVGTTLIRVPHFWWPNKLVLPQNTTLWISTINPTFKIQLCQHQTRICSSNSSMMKTNHLMSRDKTTVMPLSSTTNLKIW